MKNDTIAVVLAGGAGRRWWPLTTYKALFPFMGKSVIEITLQYLIRAGIIEAVIVTSPENQKEIEEICPEGIKISIAIQKNSDGMGGAVLAAMEYIKNRPVIVVNAGDLVDETYYDDIKAAMAKGKAFITGMKRKEYCETGYLKFDGNRVIEIVEKPGKGNEPSQYASLVFDFFPNADPLLQALDYTSSQRDDIFERALSVLLEKEKFDVIRYDGFWVPMKYPWHILDYMKYTMSALRDFRGKNILIKQNVIVEGPVWIGNNVKIYENTKIVGPCFIGDNTIIGNNNILRDSHIGANCVTGFNTDIARSYIGDNCWFHSNYIGDSVLEGNVSLGSGTVLANLRLDEGEIYSVVKGERMNTKRNKLGAIIAKDVRIGVNTNIMPGVKIGTKSQIGAGVVIDQDVPDNSYCYGKTELVTKPNERNVSQGNRDVFRKKI